MIKTRTLAWQFRSDQSLGSMRAALDAAWTSRWVEFDSDYKQDSIGGVLTRHAAARIYKFGIDFYIVNLTVKAEEADLDAQVIEARKRLLDDVLLLLSARDVRATDPTDGT